MVRNRKKASILLFAEVLRPLRYRNLARSEWLIVCSILSVSGNYFFILNP